MRDLTAGTSLAEGGQALRKRDFETAARAFCRAEVSKPDDPVLLQGAAVAARRLGDLRTAESLYRAAIAAAGQGRSLDGANPAAIATRLVDLYRSEGRFSEAEELCIEILGATDSGGFGVARSRLQVCLADLYQRQGRYIAAEQAYRVAVAQRRQIFGDRHPKTVQILPRLAVVCRLLGRPDEADALTRKADAAFDAFEYARTAGHA